MRIRGRATRRAAVAASAALLVVLAGAGEALAHEAATAGSGAGEHVAAGEAAGRDVMMQRMMALMRDGNPGMRRMMALMREDNPGMRLMMQRMTATMSEAEVRQMMEMMARSRP
jgi:hypothetical protein